MHDQRDLGSYEVIWFDWSSEKNISFKQSKCSACVLCILIDKCPLTLTFSHTWFLQSKRNFCDSKVAYKRGNIYVYFWFFWFFSFSKNTPQKDCTSSNCVSFLIFLICTWIVFFCVLLIINFDAAFLEFIIFCFVLLLYCCWSFSVPFTLGPFFNTVNDEIKWNHDNWNDKVFVIEFFLFFILYI